MIGKEKLFYLESEIKQAKLELEFLKNKMYDYFK